MVQLMELVKLKNYISEQLKYITCSLCCKYYVAPETAACGHSLCHICWTGRRRCVLCSKQLDHKTLKFNKPLQIRTENIHTMKDALAKYFNIKFDDSVFEELESNEKDNAVKGWLENSQNQFSAALSMEPDYIYNENTKNIVTTVQVHNNKEANNSPVKKIHKTMSQHDWDAIQVIEDDNEIEKENIIGPKDIEPVDIENLEYSIEQPRRSTRKRKAKNLDIENDRSTSDIENTNKKIINKNSKLQKDKEWSNVKGMKKELNKNNRKDSKLDVSIENAKNIQNIGNKCYKPTVSSLQDINLKEDLKQIGEYGNKSNPLTGNNYQETATTTLKELPIEIVQQNSSIEDLNEQEDIIIENSEQTNLKNPTFKNQDFGQPVHEGKCNNGVSTATLPEKICSKSSIINDNKGKDIIITTNTDPQPNNINTSSDKNRTSDKVKEKQFRMPFIKKSTLCPVQKIAKEINTIKEINVPQTIQKDTDDIEISIKTGNIITNIVIQRKENDIRFKVMSDQSIQTSQVQSPNKITDAVFSLKNISGQNIDLNVGNDKQNVVQIRSHSVSNLHEINLKPQSESISIKKHTASAETQTVDAHITDSLERELAKSMECNKNVVQEVNNTKSKENNNVNYEENILRNDALSQPPQVDANANENILEKVDFAQPIEMSEPIDDIDIFDTEPVKETEVVTLNHAPSEILIPTVGSRKLRENKTKRKERETDSEDNSSKSKKPKVFSEAEEQYKIKSNIMNDSESVDYDSLMSQVFANVYEDIRSSSKTANKGKKEVKMLSNKIGDSQKPAVLTPGQFEEISNVKTTENRDIYPLSVDVGKQEWNDPHNLEVSLSAHHMDQLTPSTKKSTYKSQTNQRSRASIEKTTANDNDDSDRSVVEETPEKNVSFPRIKQKSNNKIKEFKEPCSNQKSIDKENVTVINLDDSSARLVQDATIIEKTMHKRSLETPLSINKFVSSITHKSTPVARKSLTFDSEAEDQTLCPSGDIVKNTQEKEFMMKAFECSPVKAKSGIVKETIGTLKEKYCIAGSCLTAPEVANLKLLCKEYNWIFADKYTKDITHLVVSVNEDNTAQRSVKYMCALAASKWIISYAWVEKCLAERRICKMDFFEALDTTGEPGPMRSRTANRKLFTGITFFCMPPFSVLDVNTLQDMLMSSGGQVVKSMQQVQVTENTDQPALLLAEPENTQEDQFIYLAMEHSIVPVNYEWVLNCLGGYKLGPINELLLCPSTLLPKATSTWPADLIASDNSLTI